MERKYRVREVTPKANRCTLVTCSAIYEVEDLTPKEDMCVATACPGIYDMKNKTPTQEICGIGACPEIYEDKSGKYLIIGKKVNPADAGLEGKVGKDEVLIEVPKEIIDNKRA